MKSMISKQFHALSDFTRRRILDMLKKENMAVNEIAKAFEISLPSLSHHLNVLKEAELVFSVRKKQQMIYSVNLKSFIALHAILDGFIEVAKLK
jgi:DNA-binding transcriptional ArsR family regulator